MERISPDKIEQVANDFNSGLIFTSAHVKETSDIPKIFLPLNFLTPEKAEEIIGNAGLFLEYKSTSSTGHEEKPVFISAKYVHVDDMPAFKAYCFGKVH